jgi:hypothetical protein
MSEALVLAGPIVRRVQPRFVSVWVALREPRRVRLRLWLGRQNADTASAPDFEGPAVDTVRVGEHLHIAVATIERTPPAGAFQPGQTYSYNLNITQGTAAGGDDLRTLGLLQTREAGTDANGKPIKAHLALGYDNMMLPSFVLPPTAITDACIAHGSCRRVGADTPDGLAWVDDFIRESIQNPGSAQIPRPQQLFLTGDQIYADDVPPAMLYMITEVGNGLFGGAETIPTTFADPNSSSTRTWPCDLRTFPAGLRLNATRTDARLTSQDGDSHLLSFAEFCTMYLFCWSNEVWPDSMPAPAQIAKAPAEPIPAIWRIHTGLGTILGEGFKDDKDSKCTAEVKALKDFTPANVGEVLKCMCLKLGRSHTRHVRILTQFRDNLPKVRRAMANVATYMMCDDHEVTDDWNLNPMWRDRVLTAPLGRTIVRNGLLAFALFQAWGNDPKLFAQTTPALSPQKRLLNAIPALFPTGATGPVGSVANLLDGLLGLNAPEVDPATMATWHFSCEGAGYIVLGLDLRTRRGRTVRVGAPENLSAQAMLDQIPVPSTNAEVAIVMSSLTVLGPPVIDAFLGPLSYRIFDVAAHGNKVDIPGLNPDAIEAWPNDESSFERLLARLAPYRQIVLLSGDVHFADSSSLTYFRRDGPPARFAQFTSSGMKNLFREEARQAGQQFAFLQQMVAAGIDIERLGWFQSRPDLLNIPQNAYIPPALRRRLAESPVVIPTTGWPQGVTQNPAAPPDWGWRVHIVVDTRPDLQRPPAVRPEPLTNGTPDVNTSMAGYRAVVARHQKQVDNMNHDRQIVFASNLGIVRFQRDGTVLTASHDLFAVHLAPFDTRALPYTRHEVQLTADAQEQPPFVSTVPAPLDVRGRSAADNS